MIATATTTTEPRKKTQRARSSSAAKPHGPVYTLSSCKLFKPQYFLPISWQLIGIGTTGVEIIRQIIDQLRRDLGGLPSSINYLLVDSTTQPLDHHRRHFISIGVDGAGTNIEIGDNLFLQYYPEIRDALLQQVANIMRQRNGLLLPGRTPREVMGFLIAGTGVGGTSGALQDRMIAMVHDVSQQLNIVEPRVHVTMISPDMVLKDITRDPIPEQVEMIHANYWRNIESVIGNLQVDGQICEQRPDGTTYFVEAQERVFSLHKVDQTNGLVDYATTADLTSAVTNTLHYYLFTAAGHFLDQRDCDIFGLGAAGRPIKPK